MSEFLKKVAAVNFTVNFLDLKKQTRNYSTGIYTGGVKLSEWSKTPLKKRKEALEKDWFVWWSYRHPDTGKLTRQPNSIKGGANYQKTKRDRLKILKLYQKSLIKLLNDGYNPYSTNQEYQDFEHVIGNKEKNSVKYAFNRALEIKKKEVGERAYKGYKYSIDRLEKHLQKKGVIYIRDVKQEHVSDFLSQFSPRTSNNNKANIRAVFAVLSDQGFIKFNFIRELRNKRVDNSKKRIFNETEIAHVTKLLKEQDKDLLMYIRLESLMFWRTVELVRIKIEDIDFNKKTMSVDTKTKKGKIKIIPNLIFEPLKQFCKGKTNFLFHPEGKPDWDITDEYKRSYYTKRFKKFRQKNNIDPELKMGSFRHTYITTLYLELRKYMSIENTKKHLSLITGHESNAINRYIVVNDLELPEDYSHLYDNTSLFK